MCGIWGFVSSEERIAVEDAWKGLCSLEDRGPDDWGMYISGRGKLTEEDAIDGGEENVAIGNRRLSILDLSEGGNQPMSTGDGSWIVYNGEVYNYREIREDLVEAGYEFNTETDTEVVLHAFQEYGSECVERFRGMFSFAIYQESGSVFLARDRFGIKPLYFEHSEDHLSFSSELTSLLEADVVPRELNSTGVDGFLTFGYVPGSETIVEGVESLPPGSTMQYDVKSGTIKTDSYWEQTFGGENDATSARVRQLLEESISLRLRSDVPVGAFLSGGLDSTVIVALMNELSADDREDLHTYSIGFEQKSFSEANFAQDVADEFETIHTRKTVTANDVRSHLDEIIEGMDQPTIDGINTYFVSQLAAEDGLKVALSGLGSDELFYGYPSFETVPQRYWAAAVLYNLPRKVRQPIANIVERVAEPVLGGGSSKLADAVDASDPFGAAYLSVRSLFSRRDRRKLLETDHDVDWAARIGDDVSETLAGAGPYDAVSDVELNWYMRDQLLRQTDMMSMTHSLEVRVPFLDTALSEYVISSTPKSKRDGEKGLLKAAVPDVVPSKVVNREKTGFEFPFAEWLRTDLTDIVDDALIEERLSNLPLSESEVSVIRERFEGGEIHWSRLWALVVLSLWVDEHLP